MRIYPLDNRELTEEQIAVAFAMTSRSPDPFDEIARRVSEEKAADFHERWVLDYGHASVAEHAVLHLAIEDISRLACDEVENNRLGSYTEKSSRYQIIARDSYHVPVELEEYPEMRKRYIHTLSWVFGVYHGLIDRGMERLKEMHPRNEGERQSAYDLRIRRMATDACRGVLPAATLTNVGMTANARTMEHAISKLMSSGLTESREIGEVIRGQGREITPTLIKYADRNVHLEHLAQDERRVGTVKTPPEERERKHGESGMAQLVMHTDYPMLQAGLALGYRDTKHTYGQNKAWIYHGGGGTQECERLVSEALSRMGPHDAPPREFEVVNYTLELRMDYGALREFRRHRMMTQIFRPLNVRNGIFMPTVITATGMEAEFNEACDTMGALYQEILDVNPVIAQYVVTHAHIQEVLASMNLRECYHLFRLRTSERAHESIRIPMAQAMEEVSKVEPKLFEPLRREMAARG